MTWPPPPPPPPSWLQGPAAPPPPPASGRPPRLALAIVSLGLGAVALLGSWVPWFNLRCLLLALGGLVCSGVVLVRGRVTARRLGLTGGIVSFVARVVVVVVLVVTAIEALTPARAAAEEPARVPAPREPSPSPEPSASSSPSSTPDASSSSPAVETQKDAQLVDPDASVDLGGYTASIGQVIISAAWSSRAEAESGGAPATSAVAYTVTMTNDGDAPVDASDELTAPVADSDTEIRDGGSCEAELAEDPAEASALAPGATVTLQRCADVPPEAASSFFVLITNRVEPDSGLFAVEGEGSIEDLRDLALGR